MLSEKQYKLFSSRHLYDYVVILDQDSTRVLTPSNVGESSKQGQPLHILMQALTLFEYNKRLKHPPILLVGGLDAWKTKTLDAGVIRGPDPTSAEIFGICLSPGYKSKRDGISQARGKHIVRTMQDYVSFEYIFIIYFY